MHCFDGRSKEGFGNASRDVGQSYVFDWSQVGLPCSASFYLLLHAAICLSFYWLARIRHLQISMDDDLQNLLPNLVGIVFLFLPGLKGQPN